MTPSVLIVDDDRELRSALRVALRGFELCEATDARSALDILSTRAHAFDLVLSDYDMPGMSGLDLLQMVRVKYPSLVRVLLTGRASVPLAVRALNERTVHRFLCKPFEMVDLKTTLELAIRTGSGA